MTRKSPVESGFERSLFAARWLMAPMYLGLAVTLAMLLIVFLRELLYYVPQAMDLTAEGAILAVLTLIDLTLAANLLLIVLYSGYESFVSKMDLGEHDDRSDWMGTVDFGGLKLKLIASIVAISGIHLLKRFMEIGTPAGETYGDRELKWLLMIHGMFVAPGLVMALMDWVIASGKAQSKGAR